MPPSGSAWPRHLLKDLVDERGITYGVVQPGPPTPDGIPVVRVNNITPAGLRMDDVMRVDPAIARRYARSSLTGGEVLITLVGSVGNIAIVPPSLAGWNVARAVGVIPVRREIPSRWIAWWLQTPEAKRYLEARLNTTVQKTLNLRDLSELEIPLPPKTAIDTITSVLGTIEDKIDSNRRLSRLLERVAQAQFEARFVDFVGAERLIATELGEIPEGWTLKPLSEVIEINPRTSIRKGDVTPFVAMADVSPWATRPDTVGARPYSGGCRFEPGDTLMARITGCIEHGKGAFIDFVDGAGAGSTEFLVLRAKSPLTPEAVFFLTRTDRVRSYAIANMTGSSGRQRVQVAALGDLQVAVPAGAASWAETAALLRALLRQTRALWQETRTLATIRDELLPKLISGEVAVPDSVRLTEAIVPLTEGAT